MEHSFDGDERIVLEMIQNWFIQVRRCLSFSVFFCGGGGGRRVRNGVCAFVCKHAVFVYAFNVFLPGSNAGFVGGSWYAQLPIQKQPLNLCLPRDPDLTIKYNSSFAFMYGAKYDTDDFAPRAEDGNDLLCSVCRSTVDSSVLMIPGKSSCYDGWTRQYHGDLVAGYTQLR